MHVVSTAGHVDHGKSALIRRLTGIDPDRLAEEKARGLTIDLGFAWLALPSGREIGIVDVPGHERFVHNMLAGVGSVDATIFVVAANEGWRPQSEEHLAILDLLGARGGVVALTKADLVEQPDLQQTKRAVAERLAGTPLEDAPIVPCSAVTGQGLDDLLAAIDTLLERAGDPADGGRPRVYVDRSFSIKGAGTVVTGTLAGGRFRVGDPVVVEPSGHRARIRGIQTHKRAIEEATPVSRVALNLAGLERAEVRRGDAVVLADQWRPTTSLDVRLRAVRSLEHALTARGAFKAYVGSAEADARLSLYDRRPLGPGEEAFARLALASPVVAAPYDRVVLRDTGRRETVAGGAILDAHPPAARDTARGIRALHLRARAGASADEVPTLAVAERGVVPRADLGWLSGSDAEPKGAVALRTHWVCADRFDAFATEIQRTLAALHHEHPLASGFPREDVRAAAGIADARLFAELVEALADRVAAAGPTLRLAAHRVTLSPEQEAARARLLATVDGAGSSPPVAAELTAAHGEALVRALAETGDLVKVSPDLYFSADQIARAKTAIADAIAREGPLTAARLKDLLGTTRRYAIPLLEYLDATGFTRRRGDVREVIGGA